MAGLVLSAISVAALFTTCIECFDIVVVGKNFSEIYELHSQTLALHRSLLISRSSHCSELDSVSRCNLWVNTEPIQSIQALFATGNLGIYCKNFSFLKKRLRDLYPFAMTSNLMRPCTLLRRAKTKLGLGLQVFEICMFKSRLKNSRLSTEVFCSYETIRCHPDTGNLFACS
jgi:hypothetical protein